MMHLSSLRFLFLIWMLIVYLNYFFSMSTFLFPIFLCLFIYLLSHLKSLGILNYWPLFSYFKTRNLNQAEIFLHLKPSFSARLFIGYGCCRMIFHWMRNLTSLLVNNFNLILSFFFNFSFVISFREIRT